jgi:hypothetical protein
MPTEVSLPSCLMDCYKALYPKLDFSRVAFYSGLPSLTSLGGAGRIHDGVGRGFA